MAGATAPEPLDHRDVAADVLRRLGGGRPSAGAQIALAMSVFAPRGWAMSGIWPVEGTRAALEAAADGADGDEIDHILTEVWNGQHRRWLEWRLVSLRKAANAHQPLKQALWTRAKLIEAAIGHHHAQAYEASIPILFAQIEGLSYDLVGKPFFSKTKGVPAVDDETLAGFGANLEVARVFYNVDVKVRQSEGSLSRHGVMHGRELAYGTRVNSTKALTLMLSLAEHWLPVADRVALSQHATHEAAVADNSGTDAEGRLVDDRELPELRDTAYWFEGDFMQWIMYGQQGRFDAAADLEARATADGLDLQRFHLQGDQSGFWWYYELPSGHVLGWATRPVGRHRKPPHDSWWWDAPDPPRGAPWDDPDRWQPHTQRPEPINWQPVLVM